MKTMLSTFLVVLSGCSSLPKARASEAYVACSQDKARQHARSLELAEIVKADQDDRKDFQSMNPDQLAEMVKRDVPRRKRIGEIFGEGCFATAEDFASAALVYQHGDVPDHFFQTYIWAQRAVELGDPTQKRLMALGIDRYLVNSGRKQLFGSQATKPDLNPNTCWCVQQVERTFPDKRRKEVAGKSLSEAFDWLKELNQGKTCPNAECTAEVKPSPKGSVPGFW